MLSYESWIVKFRASGGYYEYGATCWRGDPLRQLRFSLCQSGSWRRARGHSRAVLQNSGHFEIWYSQCFQHILVLQQLFFVMSRFRNWISDSKKSRLLHKNLRISFYKSKISLNQWRAFDFKKCEKNTRRNCALHV